MNIMQENQTLTDVYVKDLMIPSEKVAHVQVNNPLEHALLVLIKSGYSAVPVLDTSFKLVGIISKTVILNNILGLERIEVEKLSEIQVHEVMNEDITVLSKDDTFIDALKALINATFVCIADENGYFDGIITRRAILKQVKRNFYA